MKIYNRHNYLTAVFSIYYYYPNEKSSNFSVWNGASRLSPWIRMEH